MLQRYRLRLGDGTVLGVDHDSLSTWAVDGKAMVQACDSRQWYPLKEFLAAERAAARREARQRPTEREAVPFAPSRPLPLVYPKPREDRAVPSPPAPADEAPPFIAESSEIIQALAEPLPALESPVEPAPGAPLPDLSAPPLDPLAEAQLQAALAAPVQAVEPPPFVAEAAAATFLDRETETLPTLMEDAVEAPILDAEPMLEEPLLAEVVADGTPGGALLIEDGTSADGDFGEETWIPDDGLRASPLLSGDASAAAGPTLSPATEAPAPLHVEARPSPPPMSVEPSPARRGPGSYVSTPAEDLPEIARRSLEGDASVDSPRPAVPERKAPAPAPRPSLQVLADDPTTGGTRAKHTAKADDGLPIIPLKPLHEEPAPARPGAYGGIGGDIYEEDTPRRSALQEMLLGWFAKAFAVYDTTLTRWMEALADRYGPHPPDETAAEPAEASTANLAFASTPHIDPAPPLPAAEPPSVPLVVQEPRQLVQEPRQLAQEPRQLVQEPRQLVEAPPQPSEAQVAEAAAANVGLPSIPPNPLDDEPPPRAVPPPKLPLKTPPWADDFTEGLARLARPERLPGSMPARRPAAFHSPRLSPQEPLKRPTPIRDPPVLSFGNVPQIAETGHVYDGESRLPAVWRWTKRLVVPSGILATALFAALSSESWLPKAEEFGRAAFTRIERIKQDRDRAEQERQAIQDGIEQLPHLGSETIQLLVTNSSTGVLDPPEMFRIASDAADRGLAVLTAEEAQELKALRAELLGTLRPSERERVREYDEARARRLVFPFEGRDVLEVFGRGAYALPQESRERLQALLGKVIAAGLAAPAPDAEPAPQP